MHIRLFIAALAIAAPAAAADIAPATLTAIDRFVEGEQARQKIPGIAVAVIQDGKTVVAKGYGEANVELKVPVVPETLFQTGSIGKMFAATAVMQLVDQGRIDLDASIRKYLPEAPAAWAPITVRHLLTHSSGIPDFTEANYRSLGDPTEADLAKLAFTLPLDFTPGTKWKYSNTGYVMIGILIRRITGKFYGDVLADQIFKPLGMPTARAISEADIIANRAAGYQLDKAGALKNQDWVPQGLNSTADGSTYMALADYIAWNKAVAARALLSPASWQAMLTPVTLGPGRRYPYGFGWRLGTAAGKPVIGHSGSWQGFKTSLIRFEAGGPTIVVLTNLANADPDVISKGIAKVIDPALVPVEPCGDKTPNAGCAF